MATKKPAKPDANLRRELARKDAALDAIIRIGEHPMASGSLFALEMADIAEEARAGDQQKPTEPDYVRQTRDDIREVLRSPLDK